MDEQKKQKTQKILNIVVNVVVTVILIMALLVTINNISSKQKGYTSLFGTAYMVVQSDSMDPNGQWAQLNPIDYDAQGIQSGFKKGDLLSVKILSADEKKDLKEGDIISFFVEENINGERVRFINSHRIVEIGEDSNGEINYKTKGDNNPSRDNYWITAKASASGNYCVIGIVKGNAGAIGKVLNFFNSSNGFLACIVIPSFLIVAYFAFNLIREILRLKKAGAVEEKARYEEELIAKLRAQGVQIPADINTSAPDEHNGNAENPSEGEDTK